MDTTDSVSEDEIRRRAEELGPWFHNIDLKGVWALSENFDVVHFMGVLYHLRHPLLALDLIHEHVARDLLVFQSMQRGSRAVEPVDENYSFWETAHIERPGYPKLHFIEHRYADDPANWWAPDTAGVEAMARGSGFEILQRPEAEVYVCCRAASPYGASAVYPANGSRT
jgi:tRNA (mo5U34)-methyltransferase